MSHTFFGGGMGVQCLIMRKFCVGLPKTEQVAVMQAPCLAVNMWTQSVW